MNRVALSWCRGIVNIGDKTTVISGSINDVSNASFPNGVRRACIFTRDSKVHDERLAEHLLLLT
jgi:hypothetical protein